MTKTDKKSCDPGTGCDDGFLVACECKRRLPQWRRRRRSHDDEFVVACECTLYFGGANLRLHRIRAGLSQAAFAANLSAATGRAVSQRQVCRWEQAYKVGVDVAGYEGIKKVLGIRSN